ncbi:MAG: hypothetical protein WDN25_14030 [Acetobacteraceae bacterium]
MRLAAVLLTALCLAGCGTSSPAPSEQGLVRYDENWRQRQAVLDAEAIIEGMTQARQRREAVARTAR